MAQFTQNNALSKLSILLEHLSSQARETDTRNVNLTSHQLIENNNLFSDHLFRTRSDKLSPYVQEVKDKIGEFSRLNDLSLQGIDRADFAKAALQQVEQQIAALLNAVQANNAMHQAAKISSDVRKKVRIKHAKKKNIANQYQTLAGNVLANSHALYKKLNEHHEFERRLLDMITQREQQRNKAKNSDTSLLSQEVLALHQRLGRCRQAISVIERDIEFVEKR
jgi:primosomal replication protein N''